MNNFEAIRMRIVDATKPNSSARKDLLAQLSAIEDYLGVLEFDKKTKVIEK